MTELFEPTIIEQIAEVKAEVATREHVYPREVARGGRLTQARADRKIANMRAVLATLEKVAGGDPQT